MRGPYLLGGGRNTSWSQNTGYVGVSGLHSETSPPVLGRKSKVDREFNELLGVIENMHRKEMHFLSTNRKHLEKSMLAYSERMREINKGRRSLPVIITPASGEKPITKKLSNVLRPDQFSPSPDALWSSRESLVSLERSPQHSPRQRRLSPFSHSHIPYHKTTFYGSEIESHLLSPNTRPMRHSISGSTVSSVSEDTMRSRKISTISPPDPSDFVRSTENKSTDSAYESFNESEIDFEHEKREQTEDMDVDSHSADSVKISCFPDIKEAKKQINKIFGVPDEPSDSIANVQKRKRIKKVAKKPVEQKPKKYKYNKRTRKMEKREREEIAETIIETLYADEGEEEEKEEEDDEPIEPEKKKREVCYGFRYSVAVKELLKKPNPFNVSKKDMVYKVEMENGRIVNTLGPAVLKVVDVDNMNNIRGVPLNIKREEPMSKRKKAQSNLSRNISRNNTLPPLSRGVSRDEDLDELRDNVTDLPERSKSKSFLFEKPIVSSQQSPSTVMVIGADG